MTISVIEVIATGGPEVLKCVDKPWPSAGRGEVLIKAEAIGVNFVDTYFRSFWVLPITMACRFSLARSSWSTGPNRASRRPDSARAAGRINSRRRLRPPIFRPTLPPRQAQCDPVTQCTAEVMSAEIVESEAGPVGVRVPVVMLVKDEDEAIAKANDSDYGLNSFVWTSDWERSRRVSTQLQAGTIAGGTVSAT